MFTKRACLEVCPDVATRQSAIVEQAYSRDVARWQLINICVDASLYKNLHVNNQTDREIYGSMTLRVLTDEATTAVEDIRAQIFSMSSEIEAQEEELTNLIETCQDGPVRPLCLFKRSKPGFQCTSPARIES